MKNLYQVETYAGSYAGMVYNRYHVQADSVYQAMGKARKLIDKLKNAKSEKIRAINFVNVIDC